MDMITEGSEVQFWGNLCGYMAVILMVNSKSLIGDRMGVRNHPNYFEDCVCMCCCRCFHISAMDKTVDRWIENKRNVCPLLISLMTDSLKAYYDLAEDLRPIIAFSSRPRHHPEWTRVT